MKAALPLVALIFLALPAAAQRRAEPFAAAWSAARDTVGAPASPRGQAEGRIATRTLAAGSGMLVGFFGERAARGLMGGFAAALASLVVVGAADLEIAAPALPLAIPLAAADC